MGDRTRRYGFLMPHFGEHANRANLIKGAQLAERLGFDSLWVRDHLVFHPHGMEGHDRTHIDPMVSLGLMAGATERITLGTGSLIPYRHPIQAALALASLEYVAGPSRVICGFGTGTFQHEFDAAGLGSYDRRELMKEQIDVMRRLWTGREVDFEGQFYKFEKIDIHPVPEKPIPIWYCGNASPSVRGATAYCDGWMPGRITLAAFAKRVALLRQLSEEAGRDLPTIAAIPITSPAKTREEALAKVPWEEMLRTAVKPGWPVPEGGWTKPEALDGALIFGPPETVIEATQRYHEAGLDHIVYDLRFRYNEWLDCIQLLGEEVLPQLRRLDARIPSPAAAGEG